MTAIIDYGVGNLFSLCSSFSYINEKAIVTGNKEEIKKCDRIILPGVGAFEDAIKKLNDSGLSDVIKSEVMSGKPLLGICLGMQLLFEESHEYGIHKGLGMIPGKIIPIPKEDKSLKIPHIGWNSLLLTDKKSPLFENIKNGDCVYFVHSYYASGCENYVTANTEYGKIITASVENKNVFGTQFHPEKSGNIGLEILKSFCKI